MAKAFCWVGLLALIGSLGSNLITIWWQLKPKDDFLLLTQHLLSWEVISGSLALGAGLAFKNQIADLLNRILVKRD